jgi:hypothetical protein
VISVKSGFRDGDLLRCNFTKAGSEMSVFQDLLTHLSRTRNFTLRKDKTSLMRLFGRTTNDGVIDVADCILQYEQIRCGSNLK